MDQPPLLPRPKSLRYAFTLNLILPGAGQLYMGQVGLGLSFLVGFLACFITMFIIFIRSYGQYWRMATDDSLMSSNALENLATVFPVKLLFILLVIGTLIALASMITLAVSHKANGTRPID